MCEAVQRAHAHFDYGWPMDHDEGDSTALRRAYEAAVFELDLATLPLMVALRALVPPSVAELKREEMARAVVVAARRKAWADYTVAQAPS